MWNRTGCSYFASRAEDGIEYFAIAGTATDVAAEGDLRLDEVGVRPLVEQFGSGHEHAGDAVAALSRAVFDEGALEGVQVVIRRTRQALDGCEARAVSLRR